MRTPVSAKPKKPYPDFPLFPHATRRWAKKIRGKLHYFGPWNDPTAALKKYQERQDDLQAGRTPRVSGDGLTIRDLANRFLTSKQHLVRSGEIAHRTFIDYFKTCERLINEFGRARLVSDLASDDFERLRALLSKTLGPVALGNEVQRVRTVFKYGFESGLVPTQMRFGPSFRKPNRKTLRKARNSVGPRMFEAGELRQIIAAVDMPLHAMILLGINGGLGQADLAAMPIAAADLDRAVLEYPRQKTGIPRRIPLWPETVAALRDALESRPTPKLEADRELVFITKYGYRWVRTNENGTSIDSVGWEFRKLLQRLELKRPRISFYALRHTFETIGGETKDQIAVDHVMGHAREDMASVYRERISDERLRAVVEHVRTWLFSAGTSVPAQMSAPTRAIAVTGIQPADDR
jgi:integrase